MDYSVRTDHLQAGLLQACGLNVRTKDVAAHGVVPAGGLRKVGLSGAERQRKSRRTRHVAPEGSARSEHRRSQAWHSMARGEAREPWWGLRMGMPLGFRS